MPDLPNILANAERLPAKLLAAEVEVIGAVVIDPYQAVPEALTQRLDAVQWLDPECRYVWSAALVLYCAGRLSGRPALDRLAVLSLARRGLLADGAFTPATDDFLGTVGDSHFAFIPALLRSSICKLKNLARCVRHVRRLISMTAQKLGAA